MSSSISQLVLCSYVTKELASKVTEQFNDLVNWLKEMGLKGQVGTNRANFKFKERERETWPIP